MSWIFEVEDVLIFFFIREPFFFIALCSSMQRRDGTTHMSPWRPGSNWVSWITTTVSAISMTALSWVSMADTAHHGNALSLDSCKYSCCFLGGKILAITVLTKQPVSTVTTTQIAPSPFQLVTAHIFKYYQQTSICYLRFI